MPGRPLDRLRSDESLECGVGLGVLLTELVQPLDRRRAGYQRVYNIFSGAFMTFGVQRQRQPHQDKEGVCALLGHRVAGRDLHHRLNFRERFGRKLERISDQ